MKILHYKPKKKKEREWFNSFLQTPISFNFAKIYQFFPMKFENMNSYFSYSSFQIILVFSSSFLWQ